VSGEQRTVNLFEVSGLFHHPLCLGLVSLHGRVK
jgi:hypothetical protein